MALFCTQLYVGYMLDEKSFSEAMQQYFNQVARFAFTYLHDQQAAEDVAQDVFTRLWTQRDKQSEMQSLRAYLFGAARNRALDILKHNNVRVASSELLEIDTKEHLETDSGAAIEHEDDIVYMTRALKELPERRRAALRLRYLDGLTIPEVASAMGIAPKAAEQLLIQTVKALRRRF